MSKNKFWGLRDPKGRNLFIGNTKDECWEQGFETVADSLGAAWRSRYWLKETDTFLEGSIKSASKHGWDIVRVRVVAEKN